MPTPQVPIGSGFGAASTAAEVIAGRDLTGKTIVVTGGSSGVGVDRRGPIAYEAARAESCVSFQSRGDRIQSSYRLR